MKTIPQLLDVLRQKADARNLVFNCQPPTDINANENTATVFGIIITRQPDGLFVAEAKNHIKTFKAKAETIVEFFEGYFDAMQFDYTRSLFYKRGFQASIEQQFMRNIEHNTLTV